MSTSFARWATIPAFGLACALALASCGTAAEVVPDPQPQPQPGDGGNTPPPPGTGTGITLSPFPPADLPTDPTEADAVTYAWQQFVALNWPNTTTYRGQYDPSKTIGQPAENVVWETWKSPSEVFLPNGATPVGWNEYGGTVPPQCSGASTTDFVLSRISKSPDDSSSPVFQQMEQPVGGSLTDQHGLLTRYDITMNYDIFETIVYEQWYNVQGQDAVPTISFDWGVMETKSSWRQFTEADSPATRARYYSRQAWLYTPPLGTQPATCVQAEVGLVGLHIIQKTQTRPQWTWATFEQVDNVPPFGTENPPPPGVAYSYNNPSCSVKDCPPNVSTEKDGVPTGIPTQVTRQINIGPGAQAANPQWQAALAANYAGSPFQYYELVDLQYPKHPTMDQFGDPTPFLLGNTTLETYVPQSSCLGCHYVADSADGSKPADFTFMLAEAQSLPSGSTNPAKTGSRPAPGSPPPGGAQ